MCWRTSSKNENVRSLFSLASGSSTAMDEPLQAVAFAPPPAPSPTAPAPLGRGEKIRGFCRRATPACKNLQKKVPLPPAQRGGKGTGDKGQKLILNLQQSPGNLAFFGQWRCMCHASGLDVC